MEKKEGGGGVEKKHGVGKIKVPKFLAEKNA
jgi:hypothetical protein